MRVVVAVVPVATASVVWEGASMRREAEGPWAKAVMPIRRKEMWLKIVFILVGVNNELNA